MSDQPYRIVIIICSSSYTLCVTAERDLSRYLREYV